MTSLNPNKLKARYENRARTSDTRLFLGDNLPKHGCHLQWFYHGAKYHLIVSREVETAISKILDFDCFVHRSAQDFGCYERSQKPAGAFASRGLWLVRWRGVTASASSLLETEVQADESAGERARQRTRRTGGGYRRAGEYLG
jgi:hypothetical protein